ncbi:Hyaluronan synthase [Syntrophobacter sp. SbD1]|nr:Hyaluronan synthase [Syntrophobacter sp. SbD1]
MKKRAHFSHGRADYLYAGALAITVLAAAAVLWASLPHRAIGVILDISRQVKVSLGLGMTFLALGVIAWRVWMARCYRAYQCVDDNALPAITVVIPAYNEGSQVLSTVRSIMASSYPASKMQVICIDDGSLDDTWLWMLQARREFPGRLRLIRQPRNRGKRQALLAGFRDADGSVYVTIDSDSEVLPQTLRHLVSPFVSDPRVGAVAGNIRVLNESGGAIPKMMEVSFTMAFDFTRAGQSVYGGVFCTPGALSAYRASVVNEHLPAWAEQTFMGVPATIGEDRALTNCVLGCGYRVVYQREAVVFTTVPCNFQGLRRMMVRWARSNVRESLVMATFIFRRFRRGDSGGGLVCLFGTLELLRMVVCEALKAGLLLHLFSHPLATLHAMTVTGLLASAIPALVYHVRYGGWLGWRWAIPYSFFWMFGLSWISFWGLLSASRSGWLTRGLHRAPASHALPAARQIGTV